MATLKDALSIARQDPSSERSKKLIEGLKAGAFDDIASSEGLDIAGFKAKFGEEAKAGPFLPPAEAASRQLSPGAVAPAQRGAFKQRPEGPVLPENLDTQRRGELAIKKDGLLQGDKFSLDAAPEPVEGQVPLGPSLGEPEKEKPGIAQRSLDEFGEGLVNVMEIDRRHRAGEIGQFDKLLFSVGETGGVVGDIVADAVVTGAKGLWDVAKWVAPDTASAIEKSVSKKLQDAVIISNAMEMAMLGKETFDAWAAANQEDAAIYNNAISSREGTGVSLDPGLEFTFALAGGLHAIKGGAARYEAWAEEHPVASERLESLLKIFDGATSLTGVGEGVKVGAAFTKQTVKTGAALTAKGAKLGGEIVGEVGAALKEGVEVAAIKGKQALEVPIEFASQSKARIANKLKLRGVKKAERKMAKLTTELDNFLSDKKVLSNAIKKAEKGGSDIKARLFDPEIHSGIKVENGSIITDEAIATTQSKIDKAIKLKKQLVPLADELVSPINKERILKEALEDIKGKFSLGVEATLNKQIIKEVDLLPEVIPVSGVDDFRRRFRRSAVDAQGRMKQGNAFTALTNATRNIVFESFAKLPVDSGGAYAGLNQMIKELIDTKKFLDGPMRGRKVRGGQLGKFFSQGTGAIIGAQGGPLGSLAGAKVGGMVSDVLMNRQLGNKIKRKMLQKLIKDPEELIKAQKLLDDLPGLLEQKNVLTRTEKLKQESNALRTIELQKQGKIEGKGFVTEKTGKVKINQKEFSQREGLSKLTAEAKKFSSAEEFIRAQGKPVFRGGKDFKGGSFSTSKSIADDFAKNRGGTVAERILDSNAKIVDYADVPDIRYENLDDFLVERLAATANESILKFTDGTLEKEFAKATQWAKDNGFDVIKFPIEGEVRIINSNVLKTKAQLTDIFNKANGN